MKSSSFLCICALSALMLGNLFSCVAKQSVSPAAVSERLRDYDAPTRDFDLGKPSMNRSRYIDLMEKVLSAYTNEHIDRYYNEVKNGGLKEHGFPRLTFHA